MVAKRSGGNQRVHTTSEPMNTEAQPIPMRMRAPLSPAMS